MHKKIKITAYKLNEIVPEQRNGNHTEVTEEITFPERQDALQHYAESKNRLTDVNNWDKIAKGLSATFQLLDEEGGKEINKLVLHGFIRISIPGPGTETGEGYDWVRIEEIVDRNYEVNDEELFGFRVRPVKNPNLEEGKPSHMFTESATSCFLLYRSGLQIVAAQIGSNEKPNTEIDNLKDKVRNVLVALGAIAGFSETQWRNLMKGVVGKS
jgi:hypothetical protein